MGPLFDSLLVTLPEATPLQLEYVAQVVLRLSLAIAVGACIGWERQARGKPAGLRTHMLVSLGSALFVLSSQSLQEMPPSADSMSRVIQGIAAGIGFLGAGEIASRSRGNGEVRIQGLTSAAAIWVSAALGISAGMGLWLMAIVGAMMSLFILWGVKKIE